jgi:hypothetical protein
MCRFKASACGWCLCSITWQPYMSRQHSRATPCSTILHMGQLPLPTCCCLGQRLYQPLQHSWKRCWPCTNSCMQIVMQLLIMQVQGVRPRSLLGSQSWDYKTLSPTHSRRRVCVSDQPLLAVSHQQLVPTQPLTDTKPSLAGACSSCIQGDSAYG